MYTTKHIGLTNIVLYKGRKCSWLEIYEEHRCRHAKPNCVSIFIMFRTISQRAACTAHPAQSVRLPNTLPHIPRCSKDAKRISASWLACDFFLRCLWTGALKKQGNWANTAWSCNMRRKENVWSSYNMGCQERFTIIIVVILA